MGNNKTFYKDPDAVLDYALDWTAWLGTDTIVTTIWTVENGITKVTDAAGAKIMTLWLSGGTPGTSYTVAGKIVTAGGRTDERTLQIVVEQK